VIVVDTNVIASLYLPGPQTDATERAVTKEPRWAAPLLWRSELRNVLGVLARTGRCTLSEALVVMNAALVLLEGSEYEVASGEVLRLAGESGCSAYDCEFVALARDLHVPLVTLDREILDRFPRVAVPLDRFAG
jgi:predicted nucleic acid-binding protein